MLIIFGYRLCDSTTDNTAEDIAVEKTDATVYVACRETNSRQFSDFNLGKLPDLSTFERLGFSGGRHCHEKFKSGIQ